MLLLDSEGPQGCLPLEVAPFHFCGGGGGGGCMPVDADFGGGGCGGSWLPVDADFAGGRFGGIWLPVDAVFEGGVLGCCSMARRRGPGAGLRPGLQVFI